MHSLSEGLWFRTGQRHLILELSSTFFSFSFQQQYLATFGLLFNLFWIWYQNRNKERLFCLYTNQIPASFNIIKIRGGGGVLKKPNLKLTCPFYLSSEVNQPRNAWLVLQNVKYLENSLDTINTF